MGLREPLGGGALAARDEALRVSTAVRVILGPGGARAACLPVCLCAFAVTADEQAADPGFPPDMPYYFRHTSRLRHPLRTRALMRLRCCSMPFAACPTLLDCPAYVALCVDARFAPLLAAPLPPGARLRAVFF